MQGMLFNNKTIFHLKEERGIIKNSSIRSTQIFFSGCIKYLVKLFKDLEIQLLLIHKCIKLSYYTYLDLSVISL